MQAVDSQDDDEEEVMLLHYDSEAALQQVEEWEAKWLPTNNDYLDRLQQLYGFNLPEFTMEHCTEVYDEASQQQSMLLEQVPPNDIDGVGPRIRKLMQCVLESYSMLVAVCNWGGTHEVMPLCQDDLSLRFRKPDNQKELPLLTLYQFILSWCRKLGVRHRGETVYHQIISEKHGTHAWVPAANYFKRDLSTVELLVAFICRKLNNYSMWSLFIGTTTATITNKLKISQEFEFPTIETTRSWISFKDGLYCVYTDTFCPYDDMRYQMPPDLAACAYHDVPFAPVFHRLTRHVPLHPLHEIQTPLFDSIFDTQKLCGHTKFWAYAMLGRALYRGKTLDSWEVIPYFKGRGGTGKSTLLNLMGDIYESKDVAIIPNNVQDTFGLQCLTPETLLWLAAEIKTDCKMDQAMFQNLATHERLAIARKFNTALEGPIYAPGLMAGNTVPMLWMDNAGSCTRRMVIFYFMYTVQKSKKDLPNRLKSEELSGIIRKINWCYRHAVVLVGDQDLWKSNLLSQHIVDQNQMLFSDMNPLRKFCNDGLLKKGPGLWCPESEFIKRFKDWLHNENEKATFMWSADLYDTVFSDKNLEVKYANYRWNEQLVEGGRVIKGACWGEDTENMNSVEPGENPVYAEEGVVVTDAFA